MRQIFAEKLQSIKGPVADNWFFILLVLFIIGFFITPERSYHRNGYYLLLFLPALILFIREKSLRQLTTETPFILVLAFLLYASLSLAWSEHRTWEELYNVTRYTLLVLSFPLVIYLAFRKSKWKFDDLLWWSMLGVTITALIALITYYMDHSFPYSRVPGISAYTHIQTKTANMYGLFAVIGFSFLIQSSKRLQLSLISQGITLASIIVLCSFLILAQTRGAILALIVALGFLLTLNRNWKSILVLCIAAVFTVSVIEFSDSIRGFFERGPGARTHLWVDSIRLIAEKPFLGYGTATDFVLDGGRTEHGRAHNGILELTLKYGCIGLAIWSCLTFYVFYYAVKLGKASKDWTFTIILVFSLTAMIFNARDFLNSPNDMWLLYWLPIWLVIFSSRIKISNMNSHKKQIATKYAA